jgi:hypothetical protein
VDLSETCRVLSQINLRNNASRWLLLKGHLHLLLIHSNRYLGRPKGKRPLGKPRRRWEDNIKMDLQEIGGGRGDWMELAQDWDRWRALVGMVRNFRVP